MDGVFTAEALKGFKCYGKHQWLPVDDEECSNQPRVLQRGASNLYFPVMESSISIPPWSDNLQEALGIYWDTIINTDEKDRSVFIGILARGDLSTVIQEFGISADELSKRIEERLLLYRNDSILDIRPEEFRQFNSPTNISSENDREFETRISEIPDSLFEYFSKIVRVVRLREVQSIRGFTRISPPSDSGDSRICRLSASHKTWLPGIEIRGEGIFLAFNRKKLSLWEKKEEIQARAQEIDDVWMKEWRSRNGDKPRSKEITPRFLLLHTFSHSLMRQLTLDCGYSGASLRERLYVSKEEPEMAGILIYTATSDSDGTLGGLQRQGESNRIQRSIMAAIQAMEWCSSDPLCIQGANSVPERLSKAACHACVLAPETSCEEFNRFLDRAMLIGLEDKPESGFFSGLEKMY